MKIKPIQCPRCGSKDTEKHETPWYWCFCKDCGFVWDNKLTNGVKHEL